MPDDTERTTSIDEAWPPEVAGAIAEVVARVRARGNELARLVFETLRRYPGYRELAGEDVAKVEAGVAVSVELLTSLFETGRRLAPADLAAMRPLGAQRARQGVPLADVLASVVAGIARAWQFFASEVSALDCERDRAEVLDAVDPWFSEALAATSDAMARGYLEERTPRGRATSARAALLVDMLSGVVDDSRAVECRARVIAWNYRARHGLVLFTAPSLTRGSPSALEEALAEWMDSMPGVLGGGRHLDPVPHAVTITCVQPGAWDGATAVAGAIAQRRGLVALVSDDTVGVGDVQHLYHSMAELLGLAADVARAPGAVTPSTLGVFRLVAAIPRSDREAMLGGLVGKLRDLQASDDGAELIATAETVSELGGVAKAASALGADRRTVARRLARLEERLGVSLAVRADRLLVELALHAMRLPSEPTPFDGRFGAPSASDASEGASRAQIARIVQ